MAQRSILVRPAAALALVILAGCDGRPRDARAVEGAGDAWAFGGEPILATDGEDQPFVRVTSAVRVDDRIVVGDAGAKRLAIFDLDGRLVRTVGREGRGPGEFQHVGWVGAAGDSLVVWDPFLARISIHSVDGTLVRTAPVRVGGFFPAVHGSFSDGSLLVSVPPLSGRAPVPAGRAWRDTATYLRIATTGEVLDTVGRFPGMEQYESPSPDRRTFRTVSLPFGRVTGAAASGDRFFVATGDNYRVDVFGSAGQPLPPVLRTGPPLALTEADVAEYTRRAVEAAGPRAHEVRAELAAAPLPPTIPPTASVLADVEGRLWVEEGQPMSARARGSRWSVFDAAGRWMARAEGPPRFRPFQIGGDWVLGRYTDDDGVEHVQLLRLVRPERER